MLDGASDPNALTAGTQWVVALLTGSIGVSVCVTGVATLGYLMLMGHVPSRRGGAAVIGCFIILSAATIGEAMAPRSPPVVSSPAIAEAQAPASFSQDPYNVYARASLPPQEFNAGL